MSNYCSECGEKLVGSKRFCIECGTPVAPGADSVGEVDDVGAVASDTGDVSADSENWKRDPATTDAEGSTETNDADTEAADREDAAYATDEGPLDPLLGAMLTHAMANDGDNSAFWEQLDEFRTWQAQPRGPSLKAVLPADFRLTGRDHRQAASFEQMLSRLGIHMGPAGLDTVYDRSQWDFYNGVWEIDDADSFPIDVYFGRRGNGADALLVRSPICLMPMPGSEEQLQAQLSNAAEVLWEKIFSQAENPQPGMTIDPFGLLGPGYFGRFDRDDHPIRGVMGVETNFVRINHNGVRAFAQTSVNVLGMEVWYLVDAPSPEADGIFAQVCDVITFAQGLLRDAAYASNDGTVAGGLVNVALGSEIDALVQAGLFSEVEYA